MPFGQPDDVAAEVQLAPVVQVHDRLANGFRQTSVVMDADDACRRELLLAVADALHKLGRLDDEKTVREAAERGPLIY